MPIKAEGRTVQKLDIKLLEGTSKRLHMGCDLKSSVSSDKKSLLSMACPECGAQVNFPRICKNGHTIHKMDGPRVYRSASGEDIPITEEDLDKLELSTVDGFSVTAFKPITDLSITYKLNFVKKTYFLIPHPGQSEQLYLALEKVFIDHDMCAIGKFALRGANEKLGIIKVIDDGDGNTALALLEVPFFEDMKSFPKKDGVAPVDANVTNLLYQVVKKHKGHFTDAEVKDEFHDGLLNLIAQKNNGIVPVKGKREAVEIQTSEELLSNHLVALLEESIPKKSTTPKTDAATTRRKKTPTKSRR